MFTINLFLKIVFLTFLFHFNDNIGVLICLNHDFPVRLSLICFGDSYAILKRLLKFHVNLRQNKERAKGMIHFFLGMLYETRAHYELNNAFKGFYEHSHQDVIGVSKRSRFFK